MLFASNQTVHTAGFWKSQIFQLQHSKINMVVRTNNKHVGADKKLLLLVLRIEVRLRVTNSSERWQIINVLIKVPELSFFPPFIISTLHFNSEVSTIKSTITQQGNDKFRRNTLKEDIVRSNNVKVRI